MSRRAAPDFCIIGAPKCGTTALYSYLRKHEGIFMPAAKEPHYYCSDFPKWRRVKTKRVYESIFTKKNFFQDVDADQVKGEASVWYLYSQNAVPELLADNPDVKLVVMVRNPIDMVQSVHSQLAFTLHENEMDFWKAWSLQDDRKKGHSLPPHSLEPKLLYYKEVCSLGDQIERLMTSVPPEQLKLIVFDDFANNTQAVYEEVLEFIGVDSDGRTDFPRVNENKSLRSPLLAKMIWPFLWFVRPAEMAVRYLFYRMGIDPNFWKILNADEQDRSPLSDKQLKELKSAFTDDVKKLSTILNRDLSHWLK